MNKAIDIMLNKYIINNTKDKENAIKEIFQEISLSALSRTDFFKKVAFYGGTCLRLFHNLDRFSEDLDFAILDKNDKINLEDYFEILKNEFNSYGFDIDLVTKDKKHESDIESAFIKTDTKIIMMYIFKNDNKIKIPSNSKIKIKFEVDTNNPEGGSTEYKYKLLPSPHEVLVFDKETLFAGKIHAIICRNYKNNIKGRDFYDYLFYISNNTCYNIKYLENKLKNSKLINNNISLTNDLVKDMLLNRFNNTDFNLAKKDIKNFINDPNVVDIWKKELFISTLSNLESNK